MTFLRFTYELVSSPCIAVREQANQLFQDWCTARGRLWAETACKLSYWQQLPWKLVQMAHHNHFQAILGAQACLKLWNNQGFGVRHTQSRRFLDPAWQGSEGDPPLRAFVERMAAGERIDAHEFAPLHHWLARFACVKLRERSVEGVHSLVTRTMKRAPHGSIGYISVELRFESFWKRVCRDPAAA